jgi:hypothetical protein
MEKSRWAIEDAKSKTRARQTSQNIRSNMTDSPKRKARAWKSLVPDDQDRGVESTVL